jgi:hypothetical protein
LNGKEKGLTTKQRRSFRTGTDEEGVNRYNVKWLKGYNGGAGRVVRRLRRLKKRGNGNEFFNNKATKKPRTEGRTVLTAKNAKVAKEGSRSTGS